MPPKSCQKIIVSKDKLGKKEVGKRERNLPQRFSVRCSQDFGLRGLNMPINSRSVSLRTLDMKKSPVMPVCTTKNCTHNSSGCQMWVSLSHSVDLEKKSGRKILSDRPVTAGHGR